MQRPAGRLILVYAAAAACVIIPFVLFGQRLEGWLETALHDRAVGIALATALAALLAADVLLPVPSSVLSTLAGFAFGIAGGTVITFTGMTAGCMLGYALGRRGGAHLVPQHERAVLADQARRFGVGALAAARAVPVLAEASVLLAGAAHMDVRAFLLAVLPANLGIALVYAIAGSLAATAGTFFIALAAALLLPFLALRLLRLSGRAPVPALPPDRPATARSPRAHP